MEKKNPLIAKWKKKNPLSFFFFNIYLFYLFISLIFLAVSGLSCGTWGLR